MEICVGNKLISCDKSLFYVIEDAKDYAIHKGFAMRDTNSPKDVRVHLPFCLVPSIFPAKLFHYACELQPYMNLILHKVAHSKEFLKECLSSLLEVDEFIRNIFEIFEAVYEEQNEQMSLGLIRTDYLLNQIPNREMQMKQVENNTMASGFCGISPIMRDLHVFVMKKLDVNVAEHKLPQNKCDSEIPKGIKLAWDAYGNAEAVIIFVVEEATFNICDQRILEYQIIKLQPEIKVLRYTFKDLRVAAVLKDKKLFVKNKEVAVVYYRVGYAPDHYEAEDWKTRLLIDRSCAIKCPSAGYHLAGTKMVQCYLTRPGVLERFVDPDIAAKLREVFAFQCTLDMGTEGNDVISLALKNPEMFVLKPEREGGGNNLYGNKLKEHLLQIKNSDRRKAYILMEYLNPPAFSSCVIRKNEKPKFCSVVSELGIYGAILGNKDIVYANYFAGHLLRSREKEIDEGGVAAGFGALDYCYLV